MCFGLCVVASFAYPEFWMPGMRPPDPIAPIDSGIRGGALVEPMGIAHLVEDLVGIRGSYGKMKTFESQVQSLLGHTAHLLMRINTKFYDLPTYSDDPNDDAEIIHGAANHPVTLNFSLLCEKMQWKIVHTESILSNLFFSLKGLGQNMAAKPRIKRGLINAGGYLLKGLFGTATASDVNDLADRIENLEFNLESRGRMYNIQLDNLNAITNHVNTLQNLFRQSDVQLRAIAVQQIQLLKVTELMQFVDNIYIASQELKTNFDNLLNAVSLGERGIVTPHLLPLHKLLEVINHAKENWHLSPLLPVARTGDLYGYLDIHVNIFNFIILIPFASDFALQIYNIHPFPFYLNNTVVTLDVPKKHLLLSQAIQFHTYLDEKEWLSCEKHLDHLYICPAYSMKLVPNDENWCPASLVMNDSYPTSCGYVDAPKEPIFHAHIGHVHHLFFKDWSPISITCEINGKTVPSQKQVRGHVSVPDRCAIVTPKLSIRPSKFHFSENLTLDWVDNLFPTLPNFTFNYSHFDIKPLHLDTIELINATMDEVHYIKYLHPYVSIPAYSVPILISIIFTILIFWSLCRLSLRVANVEACLLKR